MNYNLRVWMDVLPIYMYVYHCVPSAHEGQKWALNTPELEFQTIVGCRMGVGNGTRVLWKSSKCQTLSSLPNQ